MKKSELKEIIMKALKENLEFNDRHSLAASLHDHIIDWLQENGLVLDPNQRKEVQVYAAKIVAATEKGALEEGKKNG